MAVLTSKKRWFGARPLEERERFENEKLYRKGRRVEKEAAAISR
jgi:hypothetical protein